jgi:site-specific recombinase XerD
MSDVNIRAAVKLSALQPTLRRLPCRDVEWLDEAQVEHSTRFRKGHRPANHGKRYPATPPSEAEVMRMLDLGSKTAPYAVRDRALIALLWRSGLRISEALDLLPQNLDREAGTVYVANGKGGKARLSGMDPWAFEMLEPWLSLRGRYPDGNLFCVVEGKSRGRRMGAEYVRMMLKRRAREAQVVGRVAPHQLRHAHAVQLAREGVTVPIIGRQLGHSNVATTATYLAGIAPTEVIDAIVARPAPQGSGSARTRVPHTTPEEGTS